MEEKDKFQELISKNEFGYEVTPSVLCLPLLIVNLCMVGKPQTKDWALIDTGMANSLNQILQTAEERFGAKPPGAIILTHGHFDHVGCVMELAEKWDALVYAHEFEIPFLTGQADYPPADSTVDEGLVAKISPVFPRRSINLGQKVHKLPDDGSIPAMPGWRWVHTPGHTPGHVSLFHDEERVLIAGDAFTTVKQESALAVITQDKEVHGPPAYFTIDWHAAWDSVKRLQALHPAVVITGHGIPMRGDELSEQLAELAREFGSKAVPQQGRYVQRTWL